MGSNLTVYGRASSSNVQLVMWAAAELSLSPERLDYGFTYGGLDTPEFRAMNPFGKVPVMKDGDNAPIFESMAIVRYLAARYGDGGAFWPSDAAERAQVDAWAEWGKNSLARDFTAPIFWLVWRTAAKDRDDDMVERNLDRFIIHLKQLELRLTGRRFICGEVLTLADIAVGHVLYRYFEIPIYRPSLPNIAAYYARLTDREPYQEHVMVSFDELRVV